MCCRLFISAPLPQTFLLLICSGVRSRIAIPSLVPSPSVADPTYWDLRICYTLFSYFPFDEVWIVFTMSSLCQDRQPSAGTFCLLVCWCKWKCFTVVAMPSQTSLHQRPLLEYTRVGSEQFRVIQLLISPLSALWVKSGSSSMQCTYLRTSLAVQPRLAPGSSPWRLSVLWFTGAHHCARPAYILL